VKTLLGERRNQIGLEKDHGTLADGVNRTSSGTVASRRLEVVTGIDMISTYCRTEAAG